MLAFAKDPVDPLSADSSMPPLLFIAYKNINKSNLSKNLKNMGEVPLSV